MFSTETIITIKTDDLSVSWIIVPIARLDGSLVHIHSLILKSSVD